MAWFLPQQRRLPESHSSSRSPKVHQTLPALHPISPAPSSNAHASQRCLLMAHLAKPFVIFWTGVARPIPFIRWPGFQTAFCVAGAQRPTVAAISFFKMINNTTNGGLDLTGVSTPTVTITLDSVTSTGGTKNVNLVAEADVPSFSPRVRHRSFLMTKDLNAPS